MLVPSLLQVLRGDVAEETAVGVGGTLDGRGCMQVVVDGVANSLHAQAIGATTNVLARGGGVRWHTVDVEAISGETLDAQTLNRAEAANVADASAGVVDVARSS
jgi:hypothetical protein